VTKAKPIVPWLGGKRRLAKHLYPIFKEHTTYVEAFAGGAALFFGKQQSKVEVLNDVNGELVNLYRVIQNHLEEFLRYFKWALVSRDEFNRHLQSNPDTLTDVQRAVRFYYLQKTCFGAKLEGQTFGVSVVSPPKLNLLRIEEDLSAAHLRLSRVLIEQLDWQACLLKYDRPTSLIYLDPPYWNTEGYDVDFPFEEYVNMAELAKQAKGQVVISVNDIPEMREVFKGMKMVTADIRYTVGGNGGSMKKELFITNR